MKSSPPRHVDGRRRRGRKLGQDVGRSLSVGKSSEEIEYTRLVPTVRKEMLVEANVMCGDQLLG